MSRVWIFFAPGIVVLLVEYLVLCLAAMILLVPITILLDSYLRADTEGTRDYPLGMGDNVSLMLHTQRDSLHSANQAERLGPIDGIVVSAEIICHESTP